MANLILNGSTSGSVTLSSPAVSGTTTLTLPATSGTVLTTATGQTLTSPVIAGTPTGVGVLTSGTSVTASGTSVDFTSIPSWVKRITVMFSGVSTNGSSNIQIQLGDSGGVETTGYVSSANNGGGSVATSTTGALFTQSTSAASIHYGSTIISLIGSNVWVFQGIDALSGVGVVFSAGGKTLSDTLDRIRITTVNGTDTFDAGTINILFE